MKIKKLLPFMLSFLSGYVDTAVFVYMGGLFVAHVTGNFVLLGTTLGNHAADSGHGSAATLQLLSFPLFVGAVVLATAIADRAGGGTAGTRALFALVAGAFAVVGVASLTPWNVRVPGTLLLVAAMGFLNAAHRLDPTIGPPFTVMTGNVTGMAVSLARLFRLTPRQDGNEKTKIPIATTALPVAGFLVGCAGGALAQAYCGLGAMVVPALLLGTALFVVV